ncbi:vicilin-like seed storage protein At2g18540 [Actinia tenebrosa]|uniref:Coiled-coil domain-containing protein 181 n=1 Tax=Actinia tenebrosa TaxID=6105 RepID=A0A6P8IZH0_ACTTE|nr:vicilin-like seed storage protein At2g18540 [Actinia tenebrosa]
MEESLLSEPRSGVEISITSPSRNTSEDEEEFIPRALLKSKEDIESSKDSNGEATINGESRVHVNGEASGEGILADELDRKLSLTEEGQESKGEDVEEHVNGEERKSNEEESEEKPANLEMIGDRVLIERDGKFELVDVGEIKAEYFEMLGLSPGEKKAETTDESNGVANGEEKRKNSPKRPEEKPPSKPRPKTTNIGDYRRRKDQRSSRSPERRSTSAKLSSRNDDYSHIKSVYGMTEEQLKIKRRREEAIAKRKKEEKQREEEEMRRKREDAERAFQAWLTAKLEEARERKRQEELNKTDDSLRERKTIEAQQAYEDWLASKRQQYKVTREYEERRQSEEARQFMIRDRQLCDEAFRRWLKKKRAEAKAKEKLKKRKRSKPKLKKKEPLPLNSKNITYLEYYGYRNHVVL